MKFFKDKYLIFLFFTVLILTIIFSYLAIKRVNTLNSHYYDLGIMNQVVYNTSKGRFLEMTNPTFLTNMSRLAIHFDPILAFFALFYLVYPSFEVLLISQTFIVFLGAIPLYLLAKKILKNNLLSIILSLSYLFYFPNQRVVLFDFHPISLATTFLLFAFYFNYLKKYFWFYFFVFLSLLTKEHVGLVVAFFGIYQFIFEKKRKVGAITFFLGLLTFFLTYQIVIPYFRQDKHFAIDYYADIKLRIQDILINGLDYLNKLIPPVFLSLFSPKTLFIAIPELAINILSKNNNMRAIYFHYNSLIVAVFYFSLIWGVKNLQNIFLKQKKFFYLSIITFIITNLNSIYLYNPFPFFTKKKVSYQEITEIKKNSIKIWQEKLKDDKIKVSTTPKLAPFFTNRQYYYNFLFDPAYREVGIEDNFIIKKSDKYKLVDYVIINKEEIGNLSKGSLSLIFYNQLTNDKSFQLIYSDNRDDKSIEVYKKI